MNAVPHANDVQHKQPEPIPLHLRKLVRRLASLPAGQGYTITLFLMPDQGEPLCTVTPLGKVEDCRQAR